MTEELEQLLKNLKLRRMLEIYEEQLRAADKDDISYSDFGTRLVRAQQSGEELGVGDVGFLGRAQLLLIHVQHAPQLEILQQLFQFTGVRLEVE